MFRFTIRDVLWLTVVVAVLAAWLADRSREHYAWHDLVKKDRLSSSRIKAAQLDARRAIQEQEKLEEEVRDKQLQIEQLLTPPAISIGP